jgi:hypothetical protein
MILYFLCEHTSRSTVEFLANKILMFDESLWIAPEKCYFAWCFAVHDLLQNDLGCDGICSFFIWAIFERICKIKDMQCVKLEKDY